MNEEKKYKREVVSKEQFIKIQEQPRYMMSYGFEENGCPRWIRDPFLTDFEVKTRLKSLVSKDNFYNFKDLQIISEHILDLGITPAGISKNIESTLRGVMFDERYTYPTTLPFKEKYKIYTGVDLVEEKK